MKPLQDPQYAGFEQPAPVYFYNKREDKEYLIFSPHKSDAQHCIRYHIDNDKYESFGDYPKEYIDWFVSHSLALNEKDNTIYMINKSKIGVMDLNNNENKWKLIDVTSDEFGVSSIRSSCIINDKIHFYNDSKRAAHCVYDKTHSKIILKNEINKRYLGFMYNEYKQKIYFLGGNANEMFILWSNNKDCGSTEVLSWSPFTNDIELKEEEISLPFNMMFGTWSPYRSIFAMNGKIIIIFDFNEQFMYFMDMEDNNNNNNNKQWIKEKLFENNTTKKEWKTMCVVLTRYNMIHFINTYPKHALYHFKISLYDILPSILIQKYVEPLISGFVKSIEEIQHLNVPDGILRIILKFCYN